MLCMIYSIVSTFKKKFKTPNGRSSTSQCHPISAAITWHGMAWLAFPVHVRDARESWSLVNNRLINKKNRSGRLDAARYAL